jgi:hypothetical protein
LTLLRLHRQANLAPASAVQHDLPQLGILLEQPPIEPARRVNDLAAAAQHLVSEASRRTTSFAQA